MKDKFIIIAVIVVVVLVLAFGVYMDLDRSGSKEIDLHNVTLDEILDEDILVSGRLGGTPVVLELALSSEKKARGFSERESLPEDQGMLFVFAQPALQTFWMKGMQFPLDFIWLRDWVVVGLTENVPPPAEGSSESDLEVYRPDAPADMVIEVNGGWIAENDIQVGDQLEILQ